MLWGEPYCRQCAYVGPDFLWLHHHGMALGVLVQDEASLALRVVWVPDNEVFYRPVGFPDLKRMEDYGKACEEYCRSVVAAHLRPGERQVGRDEFARLGEGDEQTPTALACPGCRSWLWWRNTGIS